MCEVRSEHRGLIMCRSVYREDIGSRGGVGHLGPARKEHSMLVIVAIVGMLAGILLILCEMYRKPGRREYGKWDYHQGGRSRPHSEQRCWTPKKRRK